MHKIQMELLDSPAAKMLAVRRVTQHNKGKATAGVDGLCQLNPAQRVALARTLNLSPPTASPVRRV